MKWWPHAKYSCTLRWAKCSTIMINLLMKLKKGMTNLLMKLREGMICETPPPLVSHPRDYCQLLLHTLTIWPTIFNLTWKLNFQHLYKGGLQSHTWGWPVELWSLCLALSRSPSHKQWLDFIRNMYEKWLDWHRCRLGPPKMRRWRPILTCDKMWPNYQQN